MYVYVHCTLYTVQCTGKNTENMQTCKKHALLVPMNKTCKSQKRGRLLKNIWKHKNVNNQGKKIYS